MFYPNGLYFDYIKSLKIYFSNLNHYITLWIINVLINNFLI